MATEIELKAWVEDPEALKNRLSGLAEFSCSFKKEDSYWFPSSGSFSLPPSGLRIREASLTKSPDWDWENPPGEQTVLVTYKAKEVRDGIEINDEREFAVSDKGAFAELLGRLGLKPGTAKVKRGWSWNQGDITAELALIAGLGWFLELEILADNDQPETVKRARSRLMGFLEQTGIGTGRIETRFYTEMLREKGLSGFNE